MLGVNQVIFMALFMVAITSLIGTQDLGSEINRARTGNKTGRALVADLALLSLGSSLTGSSVNGPGGEKRTWSGII